MQHPLNIAFLALCLSFTSVAQAKDGPEPLPDSAELHRRIIEHYKPMYANYKGVEITSRIESRLIDPDTNEVEETTDLIAVSKRYWYAEPERRALEVTKNGEKQDPASHEFHGDGEPMWPIFDAKGTERYRVKVVDKTAMRRRQCFVLEIEPVEATERHFRAQIYVDAESLDLVYMDGTMADLPFAVQSLGLKYYLRQQGDLNVPDSGTTTVRVKVPIVFNAWITSKETVQSVRPIP